MLQVSAPEGITSMLFAGGHVEEVRGQGGEAGKRVGGGVQVGGVESHRDEKEEEEEVEETVARQDGGRLSAGTQLQREERGGKQGGDRCRARRGEGAGRKGGEL